MLVTCLENKKIKKKWGEKWMSKYFKAYRIFYFSPGFKFIYFFFLWVKCCNVEINFEAVCFGSRLFIIIFECLTRKIK